MKPPLLVSRIISRSIGRCLMVCGQKGRFSISKSSDQGKFLNLPMSSDYAETASTEA